MSRTPRRPWLRRLLGIDDDPRLVTYVQGAIGRSLSGGQRYGSGHPRLPGDRAYLYAQLRPRAKHAARMLMLPLHPHEDLEELLARLGLEVLRRIAPAVTTGGVADELLVIGMCWLNDDELGRVHSPAWSPAAVRKARQRLRREGWRLAISERELMTLR